jgi:glycerate kinase
MRIILAPDSFKDSLSAEAAAEAMRAGVERAAAAQEAGAIDVELCPISDGGEGFVRAMASSGQGQLQRTAVMGPRGAAVEAAWATLPDGIAVIEMAAAAGLELLTPAQRDPTRTTTRGVGQLIAAALKRGGRRILVGLGGSATTDGGAGMAQALGFRFFDRRGQPIDEPMTGGWLHRIHRVDPDSVISALRDARIEAACDVTNPLTGPDGAAAVYGPQKGASPAQVRELDEGLQHLARVMQQQLGVDVDRVPGAGAAGGLGAGLIGFAGGELRRGIDLVLHATRFGDRVARCDLCLTGEGRLDGQSLSGKAILGVADAAARHGVPTVALVGSAADDAGRALEHGLSAFHEISAGHDLAYALQHAAALLAQQTEAVVTAWLQRATHGPG